MDESQTANHDIKMLWLCRALSFACVAVLLVSMALDDQWEKLIAVGAIVAWIGLQLWGRAIRNRLRSSSTYT
jgi:hypothetical protein